MQQQRARTEEAKEARRLALLDAALDEFFEKGFTAARMDDIAARAGLSKGTLYLYFESKEDLFLSLVDAVAVPNVTQLEQVLSADLPFAEVLTNLMALAPHLIQTTRMPKLMKVVMADAHNFPDMVAAVRAQAPDKILALMSALLTRATERGEIELEDPDLTARLIVAPVVFSSIWKVTMEDGDDTPVDVAALLSLHAQMITAALGATPKDPDHAQ